MFMGLVLISLFLANIWHKDIHRAIMTLVIGTVLTTIQALACQRAGESAGWLALAVVVGFVFLTSYYDSKPKNNLTKCPGPGPEPGPDPCPPIDPCDNPSSEPSCNPC